MQQMEEYNHQSSESSHAHKRPGHRIGMKNFAKWKKDILMQWVVDNKDNPYPSEDVKSQLAEACQMSKKQVSNWFTNARKVSPYNYLFVKSSSLFHKSSP